MENRNDVMKSTLKLMRAMRRRPMRPEHEFPPAVGRMLMVLQRNDGASPAELCEYMDVRPSSMSELLSRMEENGLICRESNENDKRATRVHLSESGAEAAGRIADRFREDNEKFASCFTEAEREQFCLLCDRLSAHLESMNEGKPCGGCHRHHGHHHGPHGPHGHHRPPEFAD